MFAQRIPEQVEPDHRDGNGQTREQQQPPFAAEDELAGLGQHDPPARIRRLHAEPDEAQAGLGEHAARGEKSRPHRHHGQAVGQNVTHHQREVPDPLDAPGANVVRHRFRCRHRVHHPGETRDVEDAQHEHDLDFVGDGERAEGDRLHPEHPDHRDGHDQQGDGRDDLGGAHEHGLEDRAAVETGQQTDGESTGQPDQHRQQADLERRPRAPDDPRQDVAAGEIRSHPVRGAGRLQPVENVDLRRRVGSDPRRQDRHRRHRHDHDGAEQSGAAGGDRAQEFPRPSGGRGLGSAHAHLDRARHVDLRSRGLIITLIRSAARLATMKIVVMTSTVS